MLFTINATQFTSTRFQWVQRNMTGRLPDFCCLAGTANAHWQCTNLTCPNIDTYLTGTWRLMGQSQQGINIMERNWLLICSCIQNMNIEFRLFTQINVANSILLAREFTHILKTLKERLDSFLLYQPICYQWFQTFNLGYIHIFSWRWRRDTMLIPTRKMWKL